jgi:DNA-binding cell septation regulator SpoVG
MTAEEIVVELQLVSGKEKLRARADALIPLGPAGLVQLLGCSVVEQRGREPIVFLPSRKGQKDGQFFDSVRLLGPIRQLVTDAVLREYERVKKSAGKN